MSARLALDAAKQILDRVARTLAARTARNGRIDGELLDEHQAVAFDLAASSAEIFAAEAALGFQDDALAHVFLAEAIVAMRARFAPRPVATGLSRDDLAKTIDDPAVERWVASTLEKPLDVERTPARGLTDEQRAFADTFRQFADSVVAPRAEKIHRDDQLVPAEIVDGLKQMGVFGLSIPQKYGGVAPDDRADNMGMVVVTEELSRASLAAAGSLITRPEILAKAILKGGTPEQKEQWLPKLASGEAMAAVAVTEPDYGSDVAGIKVTATKDGDGWRLNGVKTWCTFAGFANTLMVLARTDPDRTKGHKGLSILIAEKPSFDGHSFECAASGGTMTGKAIPTIGYRGMRSFEVAFENWLVPAANLIGGEKGLGQGFYLQMEGFAGGRMQTAARALGVMQAAFDAARRYAGERKIFGKPEIDYPLTRARLAKMSAALHACRQGTYRAARMLDEAAAKSGPNAGAIAAASAKLLACRTAEWVTRDAMQIHGGMGYAEEFPVSRYFVDARVLSIFEGAEEVLALKVIARALVEAALESKAEVA